jgi:zinc transporter ZupT
VEDGGLAGLLALGLAVVHLFASKLRFLDVDPRSRWLSMAGGAAVAYVFLHLFPELALAQESLERRGPLDTGHEIYLLSLVGLAVFYGLERAAKVSRHERREAGEEDVPGPGVFWLHVVSFALYNTLVGYLLLHREDPTRRGLLLFFLAMALHFLVNDYGLRKDHRGAYDRSGRWILSAAVLLGWGIGTQVDIGELPLALLFAFLAGGIVLNVLKEELPAERESRFSAFVLGAGGYAAILMLL